MGKYSKIEIAVGVFVLLGMGAIAYLSVAVAGVELVGGDRYRLRARFATVGNLKEGAAIRLAGVSVGRVDTIRLEDYAAEAVLEVDRSIDLPTDTIASIRTEGLLGENYVLLSPGASEESLTDGGRILETEPPLDLIELIGKYAFGSSATDEEKEEAPSEPLN